MNLWDKQQDPRVLAQAGQEVWAEVPASDGLYLVSNLGRYFSVRSGSFLRGSQATTGYILFPVGDQKSMTAHRIVLLTFDGDPPSEKHTDGRHLDGHKTNNVITNLKWGTRSENMLDLWDAKRRGVPTSSTDVDPVPNPTYALSEAQVAQGVRLFEAGSVTVRGLADLWQVSRDVARRALVGKTWAHLERDMSKIEVNLGREGQAHYKAKFNEEELIEALRIYTEEEKSGVWFAEFLGIKQVSAHMILSGKRWAHVPRPEGFQYPWPGAKSRFARTGSAHHSAKLTEEQITELFSRIVNDEFETTKELMQETGLKKSPMWALLKGTTWKKVPRPEGFEEAVARLKARGNKARGQKAV